MTLKVRYKVEYTPGTPEDTIKDHSNKMMVFAGAKLNEIFVKESLARADGLGGARGAKDTGELSNSIFILSQDYKHVCVGTNLVRARTLAFGEPDPTAKLDWIRQWRRRKNVPRRAVQVWNKVRTKGPTPNPFHKRTQKIFKAYWSDVIREGKF
jgi:hypothetical protein